MADYHFVVCSFVCLSRSCILLKRRKKSTRFHLHTTAPCFCRSCLNLLYKFCPKFCLKLIYSSVDLSVVIIQWQIAAQWLEIAQWSQWRACRKPSLLFRIDDPSPSPKWGPKYIPGLTMRRVLPPGEYGRRYR